MRGYSSLLLFILAALPLNPAQAQSPASPITPIIAAQTHFDRDTLAIATPAATHRFIVEIAETPAQQEIGLMFRKSVPEGSGMLFIMSADHDMPMWMKNTEAPLDMLFIDNAGRVIAIANAKPYSTDIIDPGKPVRAVLELAGGTAGKLGIKPGDRVLHRYFAANTR